MEARISSACLVHRKGLGSAFRASMYALIAACSALVERWAPNHSAHVVANSRLVLCPIDNFTNDGDLSQDFVGCCGPDEWTRGAVVVGDEGVDPGDQLPGAGERTTADFPLAQDPEPALDLIEPGGVGGREVKMEAGVTAQPSTGLGMLVRTVVIDDEMHIEPRRNVGVNLLQEAEELLVSVACPALGHDLSVGDVESGEQGRGAMPLVVMGKTASIAKTDR